MSETTPIITEIKLEPTLSKGELVPDQWWAPPEPKRVSLLRRRWLFIVTVCVPVAIASIYLGLIASDQFISEARFIVRTSARSDVGNLASLMQGQKLSRATDETYAVSEYLTSRDALRSLAQNHHLRDILSRPQADIINRFPNFYSRDTEEELYRHFEHFLSVHIESESGISTLRVRAFSPSDARDLAAALLQDGEGLVNRLNARAYDDALRYSNQLVEEQKAKVVDVENRLTKFRNEQKIIDPNKESAAALDSVGKMMSEVMELEAAVNQQMTMAANSPTIAPMLEKIRSYRDEITKQRAQIAGDDASMAGKLSAYDSLILDRELAARGLEAAIVHLTGAREDAERQQLYLQTIVEPNLADQSLFPRRGLTILFVLGISLCIYWIAKAFIGSVMEHQA
jgi:capsular polysaccharide transport system permease protein